ncbi:FAD-dependent oxidoreductase [Methylobacterium sp. Leaf118]|uniref:FAD-dependent oxidoreductase n=1 Tax=Methylobacterium sp. Leaf118 TaxID=2876562 RepID=UPI001E489DC6|nr:NAD(P)/FAD-dependent oxidoreductase [Methylobacterium sp. Leaf118]
MSMQPPGATGETLRVDVAVIGAGLGGTAVASVVARAGYGVALVDSHALHPPEFRAEKLGGDHWALFERLGLAPAARPALTPIQSIDIHRPGTRPVRRRAPEYGFVYSDLVNALRAGRPPGIAVRVGRVDALETGPARQVVTLADGARIEARLVVIATGLGDAVRRLAGIARTETHKAHSLSLGFFLDRPAATYPFESLAWYGRGPSDRTAYLTLFPVSGAMRANLFVYRAAGEAWTRAFRTDPAPTLAALLPGLERVCGGLGVAGRVQVRPIDLTLSEGHQCDGVVLIGDAFCTTCPAPGVGVRRVLTDAERLCRVHLPGWLATPGMGADKIAAFYDDPVKRACDADAIRASLFARAMAVEPGPVWAVRRLRNGLVRRAAALFGQGVGRHEGGMVGAGMAGAGMVGAPTSGESGPASPGCHTRML